MGPVVGISFVSDGTPGEWVPERFVPPNLPHRLAIIQNTYVPDGVDMHFDEPLWRAVVDFAARFDPGAAVTVVPDWSAIEEAAPARGVLATLWRRVSGRSERHGPVMDGPLRGEIALDEYLAGRDVSEHDRDPPPLVVCRRDGVAILCVITEYWNEIGGPDTYHDSYTYSAFADRDLEEEVRHFLRARPDASRWRMA